MERYSDPYRGKIYVSPIPYKMILWDINAIRSAHAQMTKFWAQLICARVPDHRHAFCLQNASTDESNLTVNN